MGRKVFIFVGLNRMLKFVTLQYINSTPEGHQLIK